MADGFVLAVSATQLNMGYRPQGMAIPLDMQARVHFIPLVFSAQYNAERWSLTSEYAIRHLEYKNFGPRATEYWILPGRAIISRASTGLPRNGKELFVTMPCSPTVMTIVERNGLSANSWPADEDAPPIAASPRI